jgi:CRISPR-associated endonuclease/helicase Cas3
LNAARNRVFEWCLEKARKPPGFFSLTVPTGGGKTLSSMAFALAHARRHGLRRIIVVIPFLSIIEQNAAVYRTVFDPEEQGIIVEHHSAVPEKGKENDEEKSSISQPLRRAAENWDAPIIITTSVQFIETLLANQPSKCRKLHNICRSVVIFDEVQTLPAHLLNPIMDVFRELKTNYGVSFVFSSATQPAFRKSPSLTNGFDTNEMVEIVEEPAGLFRDLSRVVLEVIPGVQNWESVGKIACSSRQTLCVVNTRKQAFALWKVMRNYVEPALRSAVFHLSSAMCPEHRLKILGDSENPEPNSIRGRLKSGQPCWVVSTQLIEAGVDLDFPMVMRAMGPLDSIAQVSGRCNREFKLVDEMGKARPGRVMVFQPEENSLPDGVYRTATDLAAVFLEKEAWRDLFTRPELFSEYFTQLFSVISTDYHRRGENTILEDRQKLRFQMVAQKARVIPDEGQPVVVPFGRAKAVIEAIRARGAEQGIPRFSRSDLRMLQRFMVNLHTRDFLILQGLKLLAPLLPNLDLFVLSEGIYNDDIGLSIENRPLEDFLI